MINNFEIAILTWILCVVSVWMLIRKFKPEWIGLSGDLNKQIIDNVKFEACSQCKNGLLEPKLNRNIKVRGIPVLYMYIKNEQIQLHCNQCDHMETKFVDHMRFSLIHKLK